MTTEVKTEKATVSLSQVTKGGVKCPPRVMIYGVDGVGKTTFASEAPNAILIPTEDGAARLDVEQFPLCTEWPQVFGCIRSLCTEKHEHKTLVLDSADWAQALAVEHVITHEFDGDSQKYEAYGKGAKSTMREWIRLLAAFDYLRQHRSMEVILIAHAVVRTFHNPAGDDYDRFESNLQSGQSTSIWAKTKEWCDIVLFATFDVVVTTDDKSRAKGVMKRGESARVVYSAPGAAWDAKVRAGWTLPEKFPLSQAEFRRHMKAGDA